MKETYNEAMIQVYKDEGGYSNDAGDPGGPTNYGITIIDARKYWKADATAQDVKVMSKDVATQIYKDHYADPLAYDKLPPGVDYAVLDYGINSGISRAAKVLQRIVGASVDGVVGPETVRLTSLKDPIKVINSIYAERLAFLQGLSTWPLFGKGWGRRVHNGNALALQLNTKYGKQFTTIPVEHKSAGAVIVAGAVATAVYPHLAVYILSGAVVAATIIFLIVKHTKGPP